MKHIVGIVVIAALALAGCGGSEKVEASAKPEKPAATTSTSFKDSLVCIQDAASPVPWGDEAMREPPCPSPSTATVPEEDAKTRVQARAAQSDLRNALTAEKVYYTDTQEYTANIEELEAIEPSLDWGGALKVAVGGQYDSVVCLSTTSAAGTPVALGDVAFGVRAGTYFSETCPTKVTAETVSAMGASW